LLQRLSSGARRGRSRAQAARAERKKPRSSGARGGEETRSTGAARDEKKGKRDFWAVRYTGCVLGLRPRNRPMDQYPSSIGRPGASAPRPNSIHYKKVVTVNAYDLATWVRPSSVTLS